MLAVDGESRCQMHARSRFVKFLAPLSNVKLVKGAIRASVPVAVGAASTEADSVPA